VPEADQDVLKIGQIATQKAAKHLIWFLFICYVVSYLDRINIAFAALSMNKQLGLSAAAFGLAGTIFYTGYLVCEVPSNLLMVRVGARRWIARIMITWGLATMLTVLASGATSLYGLRLLVGIAEAGFLPGVLLYLTFWFPAKRRGRVTAFFMIAQPIAIGCGSLVAAAIMQTFDAAFGLAGWQWLFLLTGAPAVVLGICVLFYLPDGPASAKWLTDVEKGAIATLLAHEAPVSSHESGEQGGALLSWQFIRLCLAYFCLVTSLNALSTWSPLIIRGMVGPGASIITIGLMAAVPGIVAAIVMPIWAIASDRRQERFIHYAIPVGIAGLGWLCVIMFSLPVLQLIGLVLCTAGGFTGMVILWTLPPNVIPVTARPLGIALLSSAGIAASITSPAVIGNLRDLTGSFNAGIWYSLVLLTVSIVLIFSLRSGVVAERRPLSEVGSLP